MANSYTPGDEKALSLKGKSAEEPGKPNIGSNGRPLSTEVKPDKGAWLDMENDARSSGITQICKKPLVSLHVTVEDAEQEGQLTPYCKNNQLQKCLKDQDRIKGLK
jgi:hypothetical protein